MLIQEGVDGRGRRHRTAVAARRAAVPWRPRLMQYRREGSQNSDYTVSIPAISLGPSAVTVVTDRKILFETAVLMPCSALNDVSRSRSGEACNEADIGDGELQQMWAMAWMVRVSGSGYFS